MAPKRDKGLIGGLLRPESHPYDRSGGSCRAVLAFSPLRYGLSDLLRTGGGSPRSHERACLCVSARRQAWHPRCRILSGDHQWICFYRRGEIDSARGSCRGLREKTPLNFRRKGSRPLFPLCLPPSPMTSNALTTANTFCSSFRKSGSPQPCMKRSAFSAYSTMSRR